MLLDGVHDDTVAIAIDGRSDDVDKKLFRARKVDIT